MTSALAAKLQLKANQSVLVINPPDGLEDALLPLPEGCELLQESAGRAVHAVLLFAQDRAALARHAPQATTALKPDALLWIAYPKKSSGVVTDLTRDSGWEAIPGWAGVRQIAVDTVWSALRFKRVQHEDEGARIDAQYAGGKEHLRPILDALVQAGTALGADVTLTVRKSYVALVRKTQFANIAPSTRTRVDLVLKLPGVEPTGRLEMARNVGSGALTHKIALASVAEIDAEVLRFLAAAYAAAG